jgi:uncharacterized iron-regulated membrane protein
MRFAFNLGRRSWLLLHRYAGLGMALFLIVAGLTGSVIAFQHELDAWLNPELFRTANRGNPLPASKLIAHVEETDVRVQVTYTPLDPHAGESVALWVAPRSGIAPNQTLSLNYDQVFVDPITGAILGRRLWGEFRLDRQHIVPFLYRLHFTLALPEPWGRWLFGLVALVWIADCFVGFYLTLPRKGAHFFRRWQPSWLVRRSGSVYRIDFDLHRAAGLWTWIMLLVLAVSSVQFNLYNEIFAPVLKRALPVVDVSALLFRPAVKNDPSAIDWQHALQRGRALMREHAERQDFIIQREVGLYFDRTKNLFAYSVKSSFDIREKGGDTVVYIDAAGGSEVVFQYPYVASGNAVSRWLSALHMAQVWGLPYRVFVCMMGLIVALLSMTGFIIWWKKRRGRLCAAAMRRHESD